MLPPEILSNAAPDLGLSGIHAVIFKDSPLSSPAPSPPQSPSQSSPSSHQSPPPIPPIPPAFLPAVAPPPPATPRPTFVLVHGLGMSSRYMMPTAELLRPHGDVFAPDLPGFGKSRKPPRTLTIPQQADALRAWMNAHEIHRPVLIGNSLGAQIIADLAARHPDSLTCAILIAPTIDPDARRMSTQVLRLLGDLPREPPALYWIGITDYFRAGFRTILETLAHAVDHPISETLSKIRPPVLFVRGSRDPIIPQSWMDAAVQLPATAELTVFEDEAHAVNFSAPRRLVEEILRFLAKHAAAPGTPRPDGGRRPQGGARS